MRISQIQQQGSICHNQQVAYRPYKEVTVHGMHGNTVVNHTLCVLMVDISIPQKPHFLPLFWSSLTTGA